MYLEELGQGFWVSINLHELYIYFSVIIWICNDCQSNYFDDKSKYVREAKIRWRKLKLQMRLRQKPGTTFKAWYPNPERPLQFGGNLKNLFLQSAHFQPWCNAVVCFCFEPSVISTFSRCLKIPCAFSPMNLKSLSKQFCLKQCSTF